MAAPTRTRYRHHYAEGALSSLKLENGNGHGSTNTVIRRFSTIAVNNPGTSVTLTQSATLGDSVTINESGLYNIQYGDRSSSGIQTFGISINSSQLTTNIASITSGNRAAIAQSISGNGSTQIGLDLRLSAGDVVRCHTDGALDGTEVRTYFHIRKVGE
jgi:hypothetical protein